MSLPLATPLAEIPWIDSHRLRALDRLDLRMAGELIEHLPRRHEDRVRFHGFPEQEPERAICLRGLVVKAGKRFYGGRRRGFEADLEEMPSTPLARRATCRWFNMPYLDRMIVQGQEMIVYGRPKKRGTRWILDHPEFEIVEENEADSLHMNRIVPVYPLTEGLAQRQMRAWIHRLLQEIEPPTESCPPPLPFASRLAALQQMHFPDSFDTAKQARSHLVLSEFFRLQLQVAWRRHQTRAITEPPRAGHGELAKAFVGKLPFPLTRAQRRCIKEIFQDLRSPHPMNRLLQGDVGSGKTVVAAAAALAVIEQGHRAALMVPTQILAEQHYRNFAEWFRHLGLGVGLHTAARRDQSLLPLEAGSDDPPALLIGTHALFHAESLPEGTKLVIIDEQHKFGVLQRSRLTAHAERPDVLVMTATPIPRTLTMTLYGDLDISLLDEAPALKAPIITGVRTEDKLPQAAEFIRKQIESGRQAYIVYPLIEGEEETAGGRKAAAREFAHWNKLLQPARCGLLHGALPPEEKDRVMRAFAANEIQILVATSVIEVGIDVPNANLILIESAEQFGLAQLHQLRGRVGRGTHKSYCILLTGKNDPEVMDKLQVLEETSNGFDIAEADWKWRGPGDLLGTAQSGLPPLQVGDLLLDEGLMKEARQRAANLLDADPGLADTKNQHFRALVVKGGKQTYSS